MDAEARKIGDRLGVRHAAPPGVRKKRRYGPLPPSRWTWALSWKFTVLYAASDEWHQSFVPGRHPQLTDVLIDACGAATGLLIFWWLQRRAQASALRNINVA